MFGSNTLCRQSHVIYCTCTQSSPSSMPSKSPLSPAAAPGSSSGRVVRDAAPSAAHARPAVPAPAAAAAPVRSARPGRAAWPYGGRQPWHARAAPGPAQLHAQATCVPHAPAVPQVLSHHVPCTVLVAEVLDLCYTIQGRAHCALAVRHKRGTPEALRHVYNACPACAHLPHLLTQQLEASCMHACNTWEPRHHM